MLSTDPYLRVAAAVVAAVLLLSVLARGLGASGGQYVASYTRKARGLVEQATQYAHMARQDTDAAFALQHITHATSSLDLALQLVDATTLQQSCDVDVHALAERLRKRQAAALEAVQKVPMKAATASRRTTAREEGAA